MKEKLNLALEVLTVATIFILQHFIPTVIINCASYTTCCIDVLMRVQFQQIIKEAIKYWPLSQLWRLDAVSSDCPKMMTYMLEEQCFKVADALVQAKAEGNFDLCI